MKVTPNIHKKTKSADGVFPKTLVLGAVKNSFHLVMFIKKNCVLGVTLYCLAMEISHFIRQASQINYPNALSFRMTNEGLINELTVLQFFTDVRNSFLPMNTIIYYILIFLDEFINNCVCRYINMEFGN